MSLEATQLVWARSPLRGAALLVHLRVADVVNADHNYEYWQSTYRTAREARVSRSVVTDTFPALVDIGWLKIVAQYPGERRPTRYRFVLGVAAAAVIGELAARMTSPVSGLVSPPSDTTSPVSGRDTEEQKEHFSRASLGLVPTPIERVRLFDSGPAVPPPWRERGMSYAEWVASGGLDAAGGVS